jgi:hypothetical protein
MAIPTIIAVTVNLLAFFHAPNPTTFPVERAALAQKIRNFSAPVLFGRKPSPIASQIPKKQPQALVTVT